MNAIELLDMINSGETSKVQFKREINSIDSITAEFVAFSNSKGGTILFGIEDKKGTALGLDDKRLHDYNTTIANIANNNVKPQIFIFTEVVSIPSESEEKKILVVQVAEGINKPYKDNNGTIWVKQGADKRRLTDNNEIMRLFQASGNLLADEMEVYGTSIENINKDAFAEYFKKEFGESIEQKGLTFEEALKAKRVMRNNQITLAGLLFFGKDPQSVKPAFTIKVVSFFGNDISENQYRSKPEDLKGTIPQLFNSAMRYLETSLYHLQAGQNFNSVGILEISKIALIELVQNALIHRDYFKNSPVRILIFDDRVEIISPGKLPNALTIEDIKYGNPVIRNNQIAMFCSHTLPYSGLGSGVKRAIKEQPNIMFINDVYGEQFKAIIPRPEKKS